jgi:prepilin-type processing-associated H-X9-DG protein
MNGDDYVARNGMNITGFRMITLPSGQARQLVCVNKFSRITVPSSRFTFVEEDYVVHNQWRCLGSFDMMASNDYWSWWDWPAWYHNGRSSLGFADGHAEIHTWQDPRTRDIVLNGSATTHNPQVDNQDIVYINNAYVPAGW